MDVGYSPATGILVYHVPKGAMVRKGTAVCEVIDPADPRGPKARKQIVARSDGILFSGKRATGIEYLQGGTRQTALFGPTAISIHHDCNVLWNVGYAGHIQC